MVVLLITEDLS